ncbi:MAG: ABC transporter permease [Spirochaetia bacterium]|nr:ABC transporter permease [Spirochaetia bacterium]
MNYRWIVYIGKRYIQSRRNGRVITPSFLSILGIAVGVTALIAVLSVMNGLQLGFIEDILEINSYHLRITGEFSDTEQVQQVIDKVEQLEGVRSYSKFIDSQTLVQGEFSDYQSSLVRGIPEKQALQDLGLMDQLNLLHGEFSLHTDSGPGVVIGRQLSSILGVGLGDTVQMISMSGSSFATLNPQQTGFTVTGIFESGYYQYDSAFCFIDYQYVGQIDAGKSEPTIGIKLNSRYRDRQVLQQLKNRLSSIAESVQLKSWREYNRSFFGALRVEKLTMMIVLGLIFIVVAVNIKNSLERSVMEKREEIGILRAVGSSNVSVRYIFLVEGALIGIIGAAGGTMLGMAISLHINEVFSAIEILLNGLLDVLHFFLIPMGGGASVEIFSTATFYMQEVPVRILYADVMIIVLFAAGASVIAAYAASKRISEFRPAEILRNE